MVNDQALPNPWASGPSDSQPVNAYHDIYARADRAREEERPVTLVDGKMVPLEKPVDFLLCCCCPIFMLPPEDRNAAIKSRLRKFTFVISIVQVVYFLCTLKDGFASVDDNPLFGPTPGTLLQMGGATYESVHEDLQIWRLLTPVFVHGGFIHLFLNLFAQLQMGFRLEEHIGDSGKMALFYLYCGLNATLFSITCNHLTLTVGASGALLGILGGITSHLVATWDFGSKFPATSVFVSTVMIFLISLAPHVDFYAHLGGWLSGVFLGLAAFGGCHKKFGHIYRAIGLITSTIFPVMMVLIFALA